MNTEDEQTLLEALTALMQHQAAMRDVMSIICLQLSETNPQAAQQLAATLEAVATSRQYHLTEAFQDVTAALASALRGSQDVPLTSLALSRPHQPSREELRRGLRVISGRQEKIPPI